MLPAELVSFSESILAVLAFLSNFYFWQSVDYFETNAHSLPLLHTWTLAVEEQFYIVFPIFMIVLARASRKITLWLLLFVFIMSLGLSEYGWRYSPTANFYLPFTRAWELLIGCFCAFYLQNRAPKQSQIWSMAGLLMILSSCFFYSSHVPFPSLYALLPTLGAALIILTATRNTLTYTILSQKHIVLIGLLSYSIYLWHQPLYVMARLHDALTPLNALGLCGVAIALSYVTWKYIETPFRNKQAMPMRRAMMILGACAFILAGFAGFTIINRGNIESYPKNDHILLSHSTDSMRDYVSGHFKSHNAASFPTNEKQNVLIIGDSFAEDFTNILYENGVANNINIVTHKIAANCGNLYLDNDFSENIKPDYRAICEAKNWYQNKKLQALLPQADQIWLASFWTDWVAKRLPESIENIQKDTNADIYVLGIKNFGDINIRDYLKTPYEMRSNIMNNADKEAILTNTIMRSTLDEKMFIDTLSKVCSDGNTCDVFTPTNELISFDGDHLTKEGAAFIGQKLDISHYFSN